MRHVPVALIILIGCALSLTAFFLEYRNENASAHRNFERTASRHFTRLQHKIEMHLESIESVLALYAASGHVTRAEFKAFVNIHGLDHGGIQALEWIPRVRAGERAAHEAGARRDGIENYVITERTKQGSLIPAAAREVYFPVYFVEPLAGNEAARGFDLATNPARLEALRRARDSGELVVTERITLVQETGDQFGFLAFQPIYRNGAPVGNIQQRRENLTGFALGVFRIDDLIRGAHGTAHSEIHGDVSITLFDRSAPAESQILNMTKGRAGDSVSAACTEFSLPVGGRQWSARLCEEPDHAVAAIHKSSWIILAAGLAMTVALVTYLLAMNAQHRRRQMAERRTHESQARYRDVVDNAHLLIQSIDLKTGRFEFVNRSWLTALGYKLGDLAELRLADIVQPAALKQYLAIVERARESGEACDVKASFVARDGHLVQVVGTVFFRVTSDGAEIAHAILSDVSEINIARAEVDRIAADLTQLIYTANAPIFGINNQGLITEWNQTIAKITGYAKDEALGLDLIETLVSPENRRNVRAELAVALKGRPTANYEFSLLCKTGARVDILSNSTTRREANGRIIGVVGFGQDVTERRQKESELRQAQRMEAIGQLTGGIAHDFNNLLTVMRGNLQLLQEEMADVASEETQELIADALSAAEDGAELTGGLLAFSRKQTLDPKSIEIKPLLERIMRFLRRSLGEGIELKLEISDRVKYVFVDPSQLESALLNLAVNSRDAMKGSGALLVKAEQTSVGNGFCGADFEDAAPGDYIAISVTDNGSGMAKENLTKIFEPFFTTKEAGKGTGLGLSMAIGFAKQSGGGIRATSKLDHGTTISILIPEANVGAAATVAAVKDFGNLHGGTETILVVEDETRVRRFAVRCLHGLGYTVVEAENAKQALEVLAGGTEVALMFSDIVMPGGMNGHELATIVRRKYPNLLVQLASGFSKGAGDDMPGGARREYIIRKPYTKDELASRLRTLFDRPTDSGEWLGTGTA